MCDGKTRKMMWNSNKFESVNKRKTKKKKIQLVLFSKGKWELEWEISGSKQINQPTNQPSTTLVLLWNYWNSSCLFLLLFCEIYLKSLLFFFSNINKRKNNHIHYDFIYKPLVNRVVDFCTISMVFVTNNYLLAKKKWYLPNWGGSQTKIEATPIFLTTRKSQWGNFEVDHEKQCGCFPSVFLLLLLRLVSFYFQFMM